MDKIAISITEIVKLANSFREETYKEEKLPAKTSVLNGLASGLDVGLTLFEQSIGPFDGLTPNMAHEIRSYFLNESRKYQSSDLETSIWYFSYARALEQLFLNGGEV